MYIDNSLSVAIPTITTAASSGSQTFGASFDVDSVRDLMQGYPLKIVYSQATGFGTTNAGDILNSTLTIEIQTSADNSSWVFGATVMSIGGSALAVPGILVTAPFPAAIGILSGGYASGLQGAKHTRYLRFRFLASNTGSVAFATPGTGRVSIVLDSATGGQTLYADAISTLPNPV
jgi:hypothetical protein